MPKRLTLDDCHVIAAERKGFCLATEYVDSKTRMPWKCEFGHRWSTSYGVVKYNNAWCPECYNKTISKRKRLNGGLEIANEWANRYGGKCLATEYTNMHTKLLWECSDGHEFEKALSHIHYRDQWCPYCCPRPPLTIDDCFAEGINNGGRCVSTIYVNCEEPLVWECSESHQWRANLKSIRVNKSWCPVCNNFRKKQGELTKILEDILTQDSMCNFKGFEWLKNPETNRKLEIDIWFPEIKLAVEYDGRQHFEPVDYFGGEDEFRKTLNRDKVKNALIQKNNEICYFIRFSYKEELSTDVVMNKLKSVGVKC